MNPKESRGTASHTVDEHASDIGLDTPVLLFLSIGTFSDRQRAQQRRFLTVFILNIRLAIEVFCLFLESKSEKTCTVTVT
jgi:hypothetical protein